ncbi:MAG: hypothetical protein EA370_05305 [Wenzhouxiangella sp.]|nr:MAG: hypothetical protein EA370_05305 [Wenzhouxiangella sp.]
MSHAQRSLAAQISRQRGAALFVALIMLLILTLLGLSSSNSSILQERMVANTFERQLAFQRAEAGLRQLEVATRRNTFGGVRPLVRPFSLPIGGGFDFNDCTLTARTNNDWDLLPWSPSSALRTTLSYVVDFASLPDDQGFGFEFVIFDLAPFAAGALSRSSCRIGAEDTDEFGRQVQPNFYLVVVRAQGRVVGQRSAESIVQSIFWWP